MKSQYRAHFAVTLLLCFSLHVASAVGAQVDAFWNPGTASWNLAANWTPAVIPNNGNGGNTYRVFIDNGNATNSVTSLNISPTIDQLTISAGDTLSFPNSFDLALAQGPIVNNGTISMSSTGSATQLIISVSMSLTGTGVLLMSNNASNSIDDADNGAGPLLTHGAGHTIRGSGQLGTDAVALNNAGLIDANQSIPLTMDLLNAGPNTNTGTIQSSGSGILDISGTVLTNTGGLIQALGTSTVNVNNSSIIGGTLHADAGSAISPNVNGSTRFQDVTLTGLLRHDSAEDAEYVGTITNNGTIALNSTGNFTELVIPPPSTTFAGTGEIVMSSDPSNLIDDNDAGQNPLLVNSATHTIRGAGNVGVNGLHMTNDGLIQADQTTPLNLDLTSPGPNVNNGTIQAIGASVLNIDTTPLDNTNGDINALGTSTVNVNSSTIIGGNLHTDAGAVISPDVNGSTRFENITLTGLIRHDNAEDAAYAGTITNNGTISLNSTGSFCEIIIPAPGTTFAGTGEIVMSSSSTNIIDDNDDGLDPLLVNSATHTIRGAGNIGANGVHLTNNGLIQADQATKLTVDLTNSTNVNNGIMQAIGTSTLEFQGTVLDNTNGVINALGTSTVDVIDSTIIGGNLHADAGAAFSPNINGSTRFQDITLTGLLRHDPAEDAEYAGTITNNGTITLNSTGSATEIAIPTAGTTFAGTGEIVLSSNAQNFIDDTDTGPNPTLVNGPNHTIRGAGNVGTNAVHITNNGTITADQTLPMTIDSPETGQGLLNNGTINVTGAGGMNIVTGVFTNAGNVNVATLRNLNRTGVYLQTAGTTTVNGSLAVTGGVQVQGGTVKGNGTVSGSLFTNSGTIEPGDGIGQLGVQNGLTLTSTSVVAVEIGGTTPITQHDRLAVTGATHLDGVLRVSFVNGFDPAIGNSFVVMTYPTTPLNTLGKFFDLDVPCNLTGRRLAVDITNTQVVVRIIDAADLGGIDVNCDCGYSLQIDVQALILAMLDPAAFAALYPGCANADVNGDTLVNGKDVQAFVTALLN